MSSLRFRSDYSCLRAAAEHLCGCMANAARGCSTRRIAVNFTLVLVSLSLPPGVGAQKDPFAVMILSQAAATVGVDQAVVSSLAASGTYTSGSDSLQSYPFRVKALGFDRIRWEFDTPDGTVVTVIQGYGGWVSREGKLFPLSISQVAGRRFELLPTIALVEGLSSAETRIEYKGLETLGGQSLHRIALTPSADEIAPEAVRQVVEQTHRSELLIDSATSLPVRLRYYEHPRDWRIDSPLDVIFSNYQNLGGVLVPLTVERYRGGTMVDKIQLDSFQPSAPVSLEEIERR